MARYLVISSVFHLVFIFLLLGVTWGGSGADSQAVYEVDIVAGGPSPDAVSGPSGVDRAPGARRFVYSGRGRTPTLGEVAKERPGREKTPEVALPKDMREPQEQTQESPDAAGLIKVPQAGHAEAGGPGGAAAVSSSETALWKTRVRGMVEALWRTPPEIEVMDVSLKTTYLLRVGRSGELLQKRLLVSSGNVPFDRSVLVALGRIKRFPAPPQALVGGGEWVDVTMSFTPPKGAP
jgi:TonB family protein